MKKGSRHTEEAKRKIREKRAKQVITEEHRKKISKALKGRGRSEETKNKISEGLTGKKLSEEHRKNLSEAHKGKRFSLESRKKMSQAKKGKWAKPITKAQIITKLEEIIGDKKVVRKGFIKEELMGGLGIGKGCIPNRFENNFCNLWSTIESMGVVVPNRWKTHRGRLGKNEKQILDNYEKVLGGTILRSHIINTHNSKKYYCVDGYILGQNKVVEVDEPHHYNKLGELRIQDQIRQSQIERLTGATFVRIKDEI